MEVYFAPMEGITGYIYRNAHHSFFPGTDKYFTPFLAPNQNRALSPKERKDVLQEHNRGLPVVPQILTNQSEYFLRAARELREDYGYEEINLNLGCPSGTVASKGKGAGFLAKPEELDRFMEEIFAKADVKVSVKTRVGISSPEEFYRILEIYNRYPLHELIIHPRVQKDFYKNKPNWEIFAEAVRISRNPLCYNGDIFSMADYRSFRKEFPMVGRLMLGRGLLVNPALAQKIQTGEEEEGNRGENAGRPVPDKETIRMFHGRLYEEYGRLLSGDRNLLFKMKELWSYMICLFENHEKHWKKLKKASRLCDYNDIVRSLFAELNIRDI